MDRRAFVRLIPAAALVGSLFGCASQGEEKPAAQTGMQFNEKDRAAILAFYGRGAGSPQQTPPMQRAMPGGVLPSGERPAKLPTDLDARLSRLPDPYTRLVLGADVILVDRNTHAILDVIPQIAY
jgi:hypothetical protein